MASTSYPRPGYNGGFVTEYEHETLTKRSIPIGVHGFPTDVAPVKTDAAARTIRVRSGLYASIRGSLYYSGGTDVALPQLASNTSGQPRIDLVVLRLDRSDYSIKEKVITGVPAANPVAPDPVMDTGATGFYDVPLAEVRVAHNAGTIAASDVTTRCWYIGSDGQYRCTPTTRPPHEAGRVAWEHPTGRYIVSSGSTWLTTFEDSGWVNLTPASGWAVNQLRIRRVSGIAYTHISVKRTGGDLGLSSISRLCTIPDGYRPASGILLFTPAVIYHGEVGRISVESTGAVNLSNHKGIGTNQYLVASTSWPVD